MKKLFSKKYMVVFQREESNEYIVYNMKKRWEEGHTHIRTYKQAQYLVDCILGKKIPKKTNKYFLISLKRLAKDKKYQEQLQNRIDGIYRKNQYYNTPKHFRE